MQTTTTTQIALKWGAIAGLILIISSVIGFVFNLQTNTTFSAITTGMSLLVIPILILIFAMKDYKAKNNAFMSYGEGLGIGAMAGGVAGVLSGIFTFVYMKFFDPTIMDKAKDIQMAQMEEKGLTSEQIDQSMEIMKMFSNPGVLMVFSIFTYIIIYLIISLIVSAVQKNEKPFFE
jgi:hypothetical protein